jgi:hypothetical protein
MLPKADAGQSSHQQQSISKWPVPVSPVPVSSVCDNPLRPLPGSSRLVSKNVRRGFSPWRIASKDQVRLSRIAGTFLRSRPDLAASVQRGSGGAGSSSRGGGGVGVFAPAKVNDGIVAKLNAAINAVLDDTATQAQFQKLQTQMRHGDVADAIAFFRHSRSVEDNARQYRLPWQLRFCTGLRHYLRRVECEITNLRSSSSATFHGYRSDPVCPNPNS